MKPRCWPGVLLALAAAGCLEGDPNPYAETSNGAAGSAGIAPGRACAVSSGVPVTLTFNSHSARQLRVISVDTACVEQFVRVLDPGQSFVTNTDAQHPWRLRDTSNVLVFEYVTTGAALQNVDVNVP